jgi:hypothetical protein
MTDLANTRWTEEESMKMCAIIISNSLDDLELFEEQLESAGVSTLQITY